MSVAPRVAQRFLDREIAARIASRTIRAMSRAEAKRVLRFPAGAEPTDAEISAAYQGLVRETIRKDPSAPITQEALKDLNIAKDTLRGQFDRKRPGDGPNAPDGVPRRPAPPPEPPPPPPTPPPMPEGEPFASALHGLGNVDWKIVTDGHVGETVNVEAEGPPRLIYWTQQRDFILLGRSSSHYVFAKLTRVSNTRKDFRDKTTFSAWAATKVLRPIEGTNLPKVAPKIINEMRQGSRWRAKFTVLDSALTESKLDHLRGTLPLADAILGSGILAEGTEMPTGRKLQVELEPVLNREKLKALKARGSRDWHHAYDWYLYLNGQKTQLSDEEVAGLDTHHVLAGVFSYDYENGKKNLTRLRGSGFKFGPKDALQQLAKALTPGPQRTAIEQAAAAFA